MTRFISALFFAGAALAFGSDWLLLRGDAQNSGWQRHEKTLNKRTVSHLHLLWQHKLSDTPSSLTDPLILGPIITHRGIKELVFVQNAAGSVYAIDADLGRIFWSRSLGSPSTCSGGQPVQPTMKPTPASDTAADSSDSDNFSDGNRPLYTLTAAGTVFLLRPSTGDDFSPSFHYLPPGVFPVRMEALENMLTTATSKSCGGIVDASWSVPVSASGVPMERPAPSTAGMIGFPVEFLWHGKPWQARADQNGEPRLRPASSANEDAPQTAGSLATWEDADATRWIYTTAHGSIAAFQVRNGSGREPNITPSWRLSNLSNLGAPVVANGIVYCLVKKAIDSPLTLLAMDALAGEELYTSNNLIASVASSGNLAMANGHVCFSTTDSQVYCFGLPFEL